MRVRFRPGDGDDGGLGEVGIGGMGLGISRCGGSGATVGFGAWTGMGRWMGCSLGLLGGYMRAA